MIEVNQITKVYPGGVVANDAISLSLLKGEFFCLLGPNGAGKTTLVKQVISEVAPTSGSIMVGGVDVVKEPVKAKHLMGIMPQECGMFEHLTVEKHLEIFSILKINTKKGVSQIIKDLDLERHKNKKIGELSLGLKRQVLLGTALLGSSPVLVLDEPTTGIDPEARKRVWKLLMDKKDSGVTVLLTTHLLDEAQQLSDRFGVIVDGKIIHTGTIDSLRSFIGRQFVLKYRNGQSTYSMKQFKNLSSAFSYIQDIKPKDFSLSTAPLEDIYFKIVQGAK